MMPPLIWEEVKRDQTGVLLKEGNLTPIHIHTQDIYIHIFTQREMSFVQGRTDRGKSGGVRGPQRRKRSRRVWRGIVRTQNLYRVKREMKGRADALICSNSSPFSGKISPLSSPFQPLLFISQPPPVAAPGKGSIQKRHTCYQVLK